jgi:hypothetical protein
VKHQVKGEAGLFPRQVVWPSEEWVEVVKGDVLGVNCYCRERRSNVDVSHDYQSLPVRLT